MSGKVLGHYGHPRVFHCATCGPGGLTEPVEEATTDTGLDYARDQCATCGKWVDEDGDDNK